MNFKIAKLILWPKKEGEEKKEIIFESGKINVIVGDSQTGKSSIISIIDYCLGSNKCSIPVGPIRDYTQWFGLLIQHNDSFILTARREPGSQISTTEMYYEEATAIEVPEKIVEGNRTHKIVVNRLNELNHLPTLDFSGEDEKKGFEDRPSFKDFLAFCFQPQHIIANPYTLFYKADTTEHRLKLRTIFPLALGITNSENLELEKRLKALKEELKRLEGIIEEKIKIKKSWETEIKSNYIKCIELGLLKDVPFPEDDWQLENYIPYLRKVLATDRKFSLPKVQEGLSNKIIRHKLKLERKETEILSDLEERRFRLHQIQKFNDTSLSYKVSAQIQNERLELVDYGWLSSRLKSTNTCPVCNSVHLQGSEDIENLIATTFQLGEKISKINDAKGLLDKETILIEGEVLELEKLLNSIREELENLGRQNESIQKEANSIENTYRFIGKIEQNLKNLDEINNDTKLLRDRNDIDKQIRSIQFKIYSTNYEEKVRDTVQRIAPHIIHYKRLLQVENYSNPTRIDIKELTIRVSSRNGREDYLWEIGSGSNWMGFHISSLLALHEYFLTLNINYVPSFIVFDQPSQAYFPESTIDDEAQRQKKSNDLERVRAIFQAFSEFTKRTSNSVQIIVLEHASNDIWGSIENMNYVDNKRWDQDNALIPISWFFNLQ